MQYVYTEFTVINYCLFKGGFIHLARAICILVFLAAISSESDGKI